MARWYPSKIWSGEDAFIIGGGPSLSGFNWGRLLGRNTIGCNSAWLLGKDVCQICFFGDLLFFETYKKKIHEDYEGLLVTNHPSLLPTPVDWIQTMGRLKNGLSDTPAQLGWNGNSGASAINLALLLGARRVLLLGFDNQAKETDGKLANNWHPHSVYPLKTEVYARHRRGFEVVAAEAKVKFPEAEIINLTPGTKLDCFKKDDLEKYLPGPPKKRTRRTKKVAIDNENNSGKC